LPVGPSRPGRTTGPTFDIARPAIFLLPHQDAARKIIKERLDALQQACASLGQQAGLGALSPLAGKLQSMSLWGVKTVSWALTWPFTLLVRIR